MINLKTAQKIHVDQLYNKNQYVITYFDNGVMYWAFQSYQSLICIYCSSTKEMAVNWGKFDYSKTTSKHLKIFINEYTCYHYDTLKQFTGFIKSNNNIALFND